MTTATLTSKGQITIPLEVRTALGLHAGVKLDFVLDQDSFKVMPLRHTVPSLKGRFAGRVSKPVSLAEMDEAIASESASRHVALNKERS
ncbi:AbrB/MazE/SpoVT family DNA-binding domain-containing protein [Rhodoferax sp.]|uniref:AbrB/MazE/SpoVT family DNA-binding domain-containing protein n=1 Tax=Rhodoferax sp. TaxID=50421 RepID=UPI0026059313|nr:AbrB/MazE/SpoVT family DNA-binding domain-containing protein [Rhodoferax sp.]MDD2808075.1 AbrB/MazE/SpoVT family DNA-binding domain-containing protein [Rhodoferax sp.]MDD4944053.1 AbrB/MazE/SpoVT family DNA-binding domain-containing protein [Rhodoferax sp.]